LYILYKFIKSFIFLFILYKYIIYMIYKFIKSSIVHDTIFISSHILSYHAWYINKYKTLQKNINFVKINVEMCYTISILTKTDIIKVYSTSVLTKLMLYMTFASNFFKTNVENTLEYIILITSLHQFRQKQI